MRPTAKKKSMTAPVKRTRDKEATKQALLAAAIEVFAELGYDAATTKEIARRSGSSEALIQRYFDGKAGLLVAIISSFAEEADKELMANRPYPDTLEQELKEIIRESCSHHREHSPFVRVAISRAIVDPTVGKQLGANITGKKIPTMVARLTHYQKLGMIPPNLDVTPLAFALSSMTFTFGFMGPEVFGFDRDKMDGIGAQVATWLAKGIAAKK